MKNLSSPENRIFNIEDYKMFDIKVDFNNPKEAADKMAIMVSEVEKECPVAKAFNINGIGEGIVFNCVTVDWTSKRFSFKVKGEEHKGTKNKEKVPVDIERVNSMTELVETIVAEPRLLQGLDYLRQEGLEISRKNLGTYLKWLFNDVIKEELDTIMGNGFEPKEISGAISKKGRDWFFKMEDNGVGL